MSETEGKASVTCLLAIAEAMAARLEDEDEELRAKVKRQAAELTSMREALEQRNIDIRCYKMKESRYVLENVKLRELAENLLMGFVYLETEREQQKCIVRALDLRRELDVLPMEKFDARELGIEVCE